MPPRQGRRVPAGTEPNGRLGEASRSPMGAESTGAPAVAIRASSNRRDPVDRASAAGTGPAVGLGGRVLAQANSSGTGFPTLSPMRAHVCYARSVRCLSMPSSKRTVDTEFSTCFVTSDGANSEAS